MAKLKTKSRLGEEDVRKLIREYLETVESGKEQTAEMFMINERSDVRFGQKAKRSRI